MLYSLGEFFASFGIDAFRTLICNTIEMGWTEVRDLLMEDCHHLDKKGILHDWGSGKDPDDLSLGVGVAVINDGVVIIVRINDDIVCNIWETCVEEIYLAFSKVVGRVTHTLSDALLSIRWATPLGRFGKVTLLAHFTLLVAVNNIECTISNIIILGFSAETICGLEHEFLGMGLLVPCAEVSFGIEISHSSDFNDVALVNEIWVEVLLDLSFDDGS